MAGANTTAKPKERYDRALRRGLAERAAIMLSLWDDVMRFSPNGDVDDPGARRTETEIEAVHDMRVASKRSREMLRMLRNAGGGKGVKKALRLVDAVNDALGTVRELDVTIQLLTDESVSAAEAERSGIDWLIRDRQELLRAAFVEMRGVLTGIGREELAQAVAKAIEG